jgi:hypothetical protein
VVSAQHEKILGVLDLVSKEEADALQALRAAVYIVSQKQIVGLGREATVFKQAQQVGVPVGREKGRERGSEGGKRGGSEGGRGKGRERGRERNGR